MNTSARQFKWTTQKVCVWLAPIMVLFWLGGFLIADFLPIPAPGDSADDVAAMYEEDRTAIRVGLMLTIACAAWLAPFVGIVSAQMKRAEGKSSPLAYAQLAMGALLILEFVYPMMMLQVAAYRGNRPAETIQAINDLGWMLFVGVVSTVFIQLVVIGLAILQDERTNPVFPRWAGYFNLWVALMMAPGSLLPFFKDGPFAWNGLLTFWLVASAFTTWLLVMAYLLLKAIDHERCEEESAAAQQPIAHPQSRREIELLSAELAGVRTELARVARLAEANSSAGTGGS